MEKIDFATFCADPALLNEPIPKAWAVPYKVLEGESLLDEEERDLWREMSGSDGAYEARERRELFVIKGRRAQGTRCACKYLTYKIHTGDYARFAPKDERLHVPLIFQTRDVAREGIANFEAFHRNSKILANELVDIYRNQIVLKHFVISVWTCSYRAPRGISAPLALCDEVGVWRQIGSDVDVSVLRSLRPAMVQFPNRKLIVLGTPWVRAGVLWNAWEERHAEAS